MSMPGDHLPIVTMAELTELKARLREPDPRW